MTTRSTPPAAGNIQILAADLMATRATQLLESIAFGSYEPARALRDAIAVYAECRIGVAMANGADAVLGHIAARQAPDCARCSHARRCIVLGKPGCDDFEPVTQRSGTP